MPPSNFADISFNLQQLMTSPELKTWSFSCYWRGTKRRVCIFRDVTLSECTNDIFYFNKSAGWRTHKLLSVFIKLIKMSNCVLRWKFSASQPTPTWRHLIFSLRVVVREHFVFVAPTLESIGRFRIVGWGKGFVRSFPSSLEFRALFISFLSLSD